MKGFSFVQSGLGCEEEDDEEGDGEDEESEKKGKKMKNLDFLNEGLN